MKKYLAGYIAATRLKDGGEITLEEGPWEDRRSVVFPTREKAAKAAVKHGYKYTRGYLYETDNPENAKGMPPLTEATDTEVLTLGGLVECHVCNATNVSKYSGRACLCCKGELYLTKEVTAALKKVSRDLAERLGTV